MNTKFEDSITRLDFEVDGIDYWAIKNKQGFAIYRTDQVDKPYNDFLCKSKDGLYWSWMYKDDDPYYFTLEEVKEMFFKS